MHQPHGKHSAGAVVITTVVATVVAATAGGRSAGFAVLTRLRSPRIGEDRSQHDIGCHGWVADCWWWWCSHRQPRQAVLLDTVGDHETRQRVGRPIRPHKLPELPTHERGWKVASMHGATPYKLVNESGDQAGDDGVGTWQVSDATPSATTPVDTCFAQRSNHGSDQRRAVLVSRTWRSDKVLHVIAVIVCAAVRGWKQRRRGHALRWDRGGRGGRYFTTTTMLLALGLAQPPPQAHREQPHGHRPICQPCCERQQLLGSRRCSGGSQARCRAVVAPPPVHVYGWVLGHHRRVAGGDCTADKDVAAGLALGRRQQAAQGVDEQLHIVGIATTPAVHHEQPPAARTKPALPLPQRVGTGRGSVVVVAVAAVATVIAACGGHDSGHGASNRTDHGRVHTPCRGHACVVKHGVHRVVDSGALRDGGQRHVLYHHTVGTPQRFAVVQLCATHAQVDAHHAIGVRVAKPPRILPRHDGCTSASHALDAHRAGRGCQRVTHVGDLINQPCGSSRGRLGTTRATRRADDVRRWHSVTHVVRSANAAATTSCGRCRMKDAGPQVCQSSVHNQSSGL